MRLKRVYANKSSFKTVVFNEAGLSFIVAKQKFPSENKSGKSYNGVGKSLLVSIIHFCLGSAQKGFKSLCAELPGWEFSLDFSIRGQNYTSKRETDIPNKILLNNELLTIRDFNTKMQDLIFDIPNGVKNLSFRSLIPYFVRPNKS